MKKLFIAICIILVAFASKGQQVNANNGLQPPAIDKRVELMSIAARLAAYDEYNMDFNKAYVADIHQYFDKYKDHPLIKFMQEIRDKNEIGYDAVMGMAVHLNQPALTPAVKFTKDVPDSRWGIETSAKFIPLLQQFYKDTDFELFFKNHADYYKTAVTQFDVIFKQLDVAWYYKYYGVAPKEKFIVILGLGNGGANYGPKVIFPDGSETAYAVMGEWSFDSAGNPTFDKASYLPTLIHEFNHSFVNYLNSLNQKGLENAGNIIFPAVGDKMRRQAYAGWKTMMDEALVRASVIRYLKVHDTDTLVAYKELQAQLYNGFVWIDQLVDLLGTYEVNRKTYPTLESFMPQVITFYNGVAANINTIKSNYSKTLVHVSSMSPFANGDTSVSPATEEIKITFDKPLSGKGHSINYGKLGKDHYPVTKFISYADNNMAILLQVDLKPATDYQFVVTGLSFRTTDGRPVDDYIVNFRTGK